MSVISKLLLFLVVFLMGLIVYFYGHKLNEFYVNLYINDKKKPEFWEYSSSKELTDMEAKRAGLALMIVSVFLALMFIIGYFYN